MLRGMLVLQVINGVWWVVMQTGIEVTSDDHICLFASKAIMAYIVMALCSYGPI